MVQKTRTLTEQLDELMNLIDLALPMADNIKRTLQKYPDVSGTERSAAERMPHQLAECFGNLRYLSVAFRRIS